MTRTKRDGGLPGLADRIEQTLRDNMDGAGGMLRDEIHDRAPKDTGTLADAAGATTVEDAEHPTAVAGYSSVYFPDAWGDAGWRAHFTEEGTAGYVAGQKTKGRREGRGGHHVTRRRIPARPAQPFISPAAEGQAPEIAEFLARAIGGRRVTS